MLTKLSLLYIGMASEEEKSHRFWEQEPEAGRVEKMGGNQLGWNPGIHLFPDHSHQMLLGDTVRPLLRLSSRLFSTSPFLRPLPATKRAPTHGTWLSSPRASLHLLVYHSSAELVLVVSLQENIHVSCFHLRVEGVRFLFIEMYFMSNGVSSSAFVLVKRPGLLTASSFLHEVKRIINGAVQ